MLCRYVLKLRSELEEGATQVFGGAGEREQVRSVLADLAKTSSDFGALAAWALAAVASALATRLRCGGLRCNMGPSILGMVCATG